MVVTDVSSNKVIKDSGWLSFNNFMERIWNMYFKKDLESCSNLNLSSLKVFKSYFKNCQLENTAKYLQKFIVHPTELYLITLKFASLGEMSITIEYEIGREFKPKLYYDRIPVQLWYF